ncbi:MAG: glycosyltransferase family 8 protein [Clostridiales bacterium]|nr:glycosyltransferase family 8 protein [Clostridiales bacterium]
MINLLVTLDSKYIKPLKVMLKSLFLNNQEEKFNIYLLHSSLKDYELEDLNQYTENHGSLFTSIHIGEDYFQDAPTLLHYTKEMYYRLLAFKLLPKDMERILYIDPDTLIINPIKELYEIDLEEYLFAAAYHDKITVKEINRIRLYPYDIQAYYNSGVLLMNLDAQRQHIDENDIFAFVEENKSKLIMPDQDILNALYSKNIKSIDEKLYNYDVRFYRYYKIMSGGLWDMDHVIRNTVILHFCGKKKPWNKDYRGLFYALYKHYERIALDNS